MTKVSFGLSLNNRASVFLKNYPLTDLLKMAKLAEELSFDSVWVGDSLIDSPRYEPIALLGAVAAKTDTIKIGASIIQPHFRNPIMLALSWATLDVLSGGRTILTLGTGGGTPSGVQKEAELVGMDLKKRGKALEENIQILRKLWRGEIVDFEGEVYKIAGAKIGYLPLQSPPPIWVAAGVYVPKKQERQISATPGYTKEHGAFSGVFKRAASLGDGWFTIMASPHEFQESSEKISRYAKDFGRSPGSIVRAVECWVNVNSDRDRAKSEITSMIEGYFANPVDPETVERWSIYGSPKDCLDRIQQYISAGAEVIKFIVGSPEQLEHLQKIAESLMSSF